MAKFISLLRVLDDKLIYVNPDYIKGFWTAERSVSEGFTSRFKLVTVTVLDIRDRCEVWVKETPEEILDKINNDDGLSRVGKLP